MEKFFLDGRALLLLIASKSKSETGIVLLLSLLISFIIAFALAVELLNTTLNKKNFSVNQQRDALFYTIEQNREWGMVKGLIQSSNCFFLASTPNDYPEKLKEKQIVGCTKKVDNITLYAVVEDLGVFSDLDIHWYRLTILGEDSQAHDLVLQTVFTESKTRLIMEQQSWRIV